MALEFKWSWLVLLPGIGAMFVAFAFHEVEHPWVLFCVQWWWILQLVCFGLWMLWGACALLLSAVQWYIDRPSSRR